MTKLLIISDLHIDQYNGLKERLNDYLTLAEDLVKVAGVEGISDLYLLGDTVNKSVTTPEVLNTLSAFISILQTNKIQVHYILGQHDYNISQVSSDLSHTYLQFFPIEYVAGTVQNIDGVRVAFTDYTRAKKVIAPKCDVLLSHISFGYQEYDDSQVSMFTIAGDIHTPSDFQYNRPAYSVSPPIQLHPSQPEQGYAMILTLDRGEASCKRYELPIIHKLEKMVERKINKIPIKDIKIEEFNIPEDVKFIHSEIIEKVQKPEPLKTLKLKKLVIHNFKSIEEEVINFASLGHIIYISGNNGAGKSSIMEALIVSFTGKNISKYSRNNDKNNYPELSVVFDYEDAEYGIYRSSAGVVLTKNGVNVPLAKSKSDCQGVLNSMFPIISILDTLFIHTYTHLFYKFDELLIKYLNLDYYEKMCEVVDDMIKGKTEESKKIERDIDNLNAKIEVYVQNLDTSLKECDNIDTEYDVDAVKEQIQLLTNKEKNYKDANLRLTNAKTKLESVNKVLESINQIPKHLNELIEDCEQNKKNEIARKTINSRIYNLRQSDKSAICPSCGTKFNINDIMIKDAEKELKNIPSDVVVSYNYNSLLYYQSLKKSEESYKANKEQLEKEIKQIEDELDNITSIEIPYSLNELLSMLEKVKTKEQLNINIDRYREGINQYRTQITELNKKNTDLKSYIVKLNVYKNLFDITNMKSIPYKTLESCLSSASDDRVKFTTSRQLVSGANRYNISASLNGIDYIQCSEGEKTFIDVLAMGLLLSTQPTLPFILLDETLSTLKSDNYDKSLEVIDTYNVDKIIITSHQLDFNHFDDKICR